MEQERNIRNIQLNAISRPSLLQSAAQENDWLAGYVSQSSEPNSGIGQAKLPTHRRIRKRCNCNDRYADFHGDTFSSSLWGQAFGHQGFIRSSVNTTGCHHQECPMYPSSLTVTTARFSIGLCGALLNRAIEASISIIHGAGGSSISPRLHCSRFVSDDCKAIKLVEFDDNDIPHMTTLGDWEGFLNARTREIDRLFRLGKATPYDVDWRGYTLLHVRSQEILLHCANCYSVPAVSWMTTLCMG